MLLYGSLEATIFSNLPKTTVVRGEKAHRSPSYWLEDDIVEPSEARVWCRMQSPGSYAFVSNKPQLSLFHDAYRTAPLHPNTSM